MQHKFYDEKQQQQQQQQQQQRQNPDNVDENIKLHFCLKLARTEPWYNMLQTLDFGDTEKYEVLSFCQTNTLEVKESTKRSQISNFLVSYIIAAWYLMLR